MNICFIKTKNTQILNIKNLAIVSLSLLTLIGDSLSDVIKCDPRNSQQHQTRGYSKTTDGPQKTYKMALHGDILAGDDILVNGWLIIGMDGKISRIGCLGSQENNIKEAEILESEGVVNLRENIISPAFINPHDHIKYNTIYPLSSKKYQSKIQSEPGMNPLDLEALSKLQNSDLYGLRHEWRVSKLTNPAQPNKEILADAMLWNELRYIMSGTLIFADSEKRGNNFIENSSDLAKKAGYRSLYETFPYLDDKTMTQERLNTIKSGQIKSYQEGLKGSGAIYDCKYHNSIFRTGVADRDSTGKDVRGPRWADLNYKDTIVAHLGEGLDDYSYNETYCFLKDRSMIPSEWRPNLSMIHALRIDRNLMPLMLETPKVNVVWSPRSNLYLYGKTVNVKYLKQNGITIALGADWTPSGSLNLFRELACAAKYNRENNNIFTYKELWEMVTKNASKVLGLPLVGKIEEGQRANLLVLTSPDNKNAMETPQSDDGSEPYYEAVVKSDNSNVILVLQDGEPLYGDRDIITSLFADSAEILDNKCALLAVCKDIANKMICLKNYNPKEHGNSRLQDFILKYQEKGNSDSDFARFYKLSACNNQRLKSEPSCDER